MYKSFINSVTFRIKYAGEEKDRVKKGNLDEKKSCEFVSRLLTANQTRTTRTHHTFIGLITHHSKADGGTNAWVELEADIGAITFTLERITSNTV